VAADFSLRVVECGRETKAAGVKRFGEAIRLYEFRRPHRVLIWVIATPQ
jgi:hypothetical protein